MAQISFFLISQANTLLTTADRIDLYKVSAPSVKVASTDPVGNELTIVDNHDGVYYIDAEPDDFPTDIYFAKVNGVTQGEFANVVLINSDVVDHLNDAAKHREIDDNGSSATDLLSAEKILALLEAKVEIDDSKGDGDTDYAWSADKITDELANKADQSAVGDRTYTNKHLVSDDESVTDSIDALDSAIGNLDFSSDPILGRFYEIVQNHLPWFNLTNAIKALSNQVSANLKAITNGTDIFNNRVVYVDTAEAAVSAGSYATAREYAETANSPITKIRSVFYKRPQDKYLIVRLQAKCTVAAGKINYNDSEQDVYEDVNNSSYSVKTLTVDISSYPEGLYSFGINTYIEAGSSGTITIRNIHVSIEGVTSA